jgi:hypothetical protein
MNKLEVTLKQHTPLIHFQHEQEGATLRASEVKPKLDRFILEKLGVNGKQIAEKKGWIIKGQERALDYKMRIWTNEDDTYRGEYLITSYIKQENITKLRAKKINVINKSPYFAQEESNTKIINNDMGWDSIDKKGILHYEIILEIKSFDASLIQEIAKHVQSFFLSMNFGTRQSKGFGSFEATKILFNNEKEVPLNNDIENLMKTLFSFVYVKTLDRHNLNIIFSRINNDYKLLKSGDNNPKTKYAKSKLMLFGLKKNIESKKIRWDKKFIKSQINGKYETAKKNEFYKLKGTNYSSKDDTDNKKCKYLRALLGLAEQFEFQLENPPDGDKKNKLIVKVKAKSNPNIQRIQSPILFKVLDSTIYLVGNEVPQEILGEEFSFTVSIKGDNKYQNVPIEKSLFIPKNFSLCAFMRFAMTDVKLGYTMIK